MRDESLIGSLLDDYLKRKRAYDILRWVLVGPFLIALGISQAAFAWMGDAFVMRFVYPAILVLLGAVVLFCSVRMLLGKSIFPSDVRSEKRQNRAAGTLGHLLPGEFGPFELNEALREDLQFLIIHQFVTMTVSLDRLPEHGENLSNYVTVTPKVKAYLARGLAG